MNNHDNAIGVFDSGVGGLTVASAIKKLLPDESIIYFGDTTHLPYGDKSVESVRQFSRGIADFLLDQKVKVIVMACNTASANAFQSVKEHVKGQAIVINVVDPVVDEIASNSIFRRIGVIGTKGTIASRAYETKLKERRPDIDVRSMATPLFVPMIEEGFIYDDISNAIIRAYLSKDEMNGINAMILGCTHYPIIRNQINKYFNFNVEVFDSAQIVASHVRNVLKENDLLSTSPATYQFHVSDFTAYFEAIAKMFFEETIKLQKADIWN